MLESGQPQALPAIYEFYRRRQVSALSDFFFEQAYEESKALLDQLSTRKTSLKELNLQNIRNPLKGRVLSTYASVVAIHAHTYEDTAELERAYKLFEEAEDELVDPEERSQQRIYMIHTLLEYKRIDPEATLDTRIDELLVEIDRSIDLFLKDKLPEEIFRIDMRIACRLKVALIRNERYSNLSKISAKMASKIQDVDTTMKNTLAFH